MCVVVLSLRGVYVCSCTFSEVCVCVLGRSLMCTFYEFESPVCHFPGLSHEF